MYPKQDGRQSSVYIYICQIVQGLLEKPCAMKVAYDKYDLINFKQPKAQQLSNLKQVSLSMT